MSVSSTHQVEFTSPAPAAIRPAPWTESGLRRSLTALQEQALERPGTPADAHVVEEIVRLGMRPEVLAALRGRRDPQEAIRDLATRYAFQALMVKGRSSRELDDLSQAMVRRTLDVINQRAAQVASRLGEDPLDEDPGLLLSLCKGLSRYVPKIPICAHISWKLRHYESAVSRAMRQIEHLVKQPEVAERFVAYVLDAPVPDVFKAQLLQLARGGGRAGLNYEAVIRFFALPATVEFVKDFAATVQTARTLYDEEEYADIAWQGRRRLPAQRRQGYLEAALAQLERLREASLDTDDFDLHDLVD